MEANTVNNQVTSLFEQPSINAVTVNVSPVNGTTTDGSHGDVNSATEELKKKRGRPRKYNTPEEAYAARKLQLAAAATAAATTSFSSLNKKDKKFHSSSLGDSREGFNLHIVKVPSGEDIGQHIMSLMQKNSRCEMCILSASGSISSATLRQPATSGGNITYEGRFDIVSLTGSYVRNEHKGRSGGISVCLSHSDGQLIGGSIAGPLKASDPVQVIVGTFSIKDDVSTSQLPSPVSEPASTLGFRPAVSSSNGNTIPANGHQSIVGSHFMPQQFGVNVVPFHPSSDWGSRPDSQNAGFELIGGNGHGTQQSPENGDY